jgi:hypothetical protein
VPPALLAGSACAVPDRAIDATPAEPRMTPKTARSPSFLREFSTTTFQDTREGGRGFAPT